MLSVGPSADERVPPPFRLDAGDAELVWRAQLGSVAAFEQLVLGFGPRVRGGDESIFRPSGAEPARRRAARARPPAPNL
jgi:hypothetical protein